MERCEVERDMKQGKTNFLNLLFDPGQGTCFTAKPWGTEVRTFPLPHDVFFSINAIRTDLDSDPTESYHSTDKPRRADANVECFRNFLIELDDYPLEKQIDYVTSVYPVSAITFSGKKSYHFIVSLEEPLESYEQYMKWSDALLSGLKRADQTCKNPSRLSRLPGVRRPETDKEQKLVFLGERVKNSLLYELIEKNIRINTKFYEQDPVNKGMERISVDLLQALENPNKLVLSFGSRNKFFFWLYNRCKELGISKETRQRFVDRAYSNLVDTRDFSIREAYVAARLRY